MLNKRSKNRINVGCLFALLIGIQSCAVHENPSSIRTTARPSITSAATSNSEMSLLGLDTILIDAGLTISASESYDGNPSPSVEANANAVFTDSVGRLVSLVTLNGDPLNRATVVGSYFSNVSSVYGSGVAHWAVAGYDGGSFHDTSSIPDNFSSFGIHTGDTVSKAAGFTLTYGGNDGGDLVVHANFDFARTLYWAGDSAVARDSNNTTAHLEKTVADNGSLVITAGDLAGFRVGTYFTLMMEHWIYHIGVSTTGRPIGVYSSFTSELILYLKS